MIRDLPLEALLIALLRAIFSSNFFQYLAPLGDMNRSYAKLNNNYGKLWCFIIGYLYDFLMGKVLGKADIIKST